MKPYYEDSHTKLFHGDCREIVPELDMQDTICVTDPPYGCNATTGWGGVYDKFRIIGDKDAKVRDYLISILDCPWIMFGSPRIPRPQCDAVLIWSKGEHTGMGDLSFPWKPDFEEIYVKGKQFDGKRTSSILRFNARTDSGRSHPTEKPIDLMKELTGKCTCGTILDPFSGSGTTLVAAKQMGRKAVGIELEERYCEITAKRLRQEYFDLSFEPLPAKQEREQNLFENE